MRVTALSPYSLSVPGGVQGQVVGLARELAARGHDVTVLAPCAPEGALGDLGGARLVGLGRSRAVEVNGSSAPVSISPLAIGRALAAIARLAPDVVHIHEPLVPGPPLGVLLAARRPLVGTFHRADADAPYRLLGRVAGGAAGRLAVATAVSGVARATAAAVLGTHLGACRVLFNGVDVALLGTATPWPAPVPAILFVGRNEPRKGLSTLLAAHARLEGPTRLWIAGPGTTSGDLRRRASGDERVEWLGQLDDAELARRLAGARVLVAPSLAGESFGLVLLEAMAAGTPVIASDLPGYREAAGDAAWFVPPGDAAALAGALDRLLPDEQARNALAAAGRIRAAVRSLGALAAAYETIYEGIARDRRRTTPRDS